MERTLDIYETLTKSALYALDSKSRDLVNETYGQVKMALQLGAITQQEFNKLNDMLVRNGINNPQAGLH